MVTIISLANIHHHTVTIFFFMMRNFKIYSLSNIQIYNIVLLTTVTIYITSPGLPDFISGSLYLLPIFPPPTFGNQQFLLSRSLVLFLFIFYFLLVFRFPIQVLTYV